MGLDVRVTYKNRKTGETLPDMEKNYCGRWMMEPVRAWVSDELYGKDILLDPNSDDYKGLVAEVTNELVERAKEVDDLEDLLNYGLGDFATAIAAVPMLAALGIDVYVEADW